MKLKGDEGDGAENYRFKTQNSHCVPELIRFPISCHPLRTRNYRTWMIIIKGDAGAFGFNQRTTCSHSRTKAKDRNDQRNPTHESG